MENFNEKGKNPDSGRKPVQNSGAGSNMATELIKHITVNFFRNLSGMNNCNREGKNPPNKKLPIKGIK